MSETLQAWLCFECDRQWLQMDDPSQDVLCPNCNSLERVRMDMRDDAIQLEVYEAQQSYKAPEPEFELDELVTKDVKEPKIEFNYGNCKICEIPLTEDYEHVSFCGDCAEETFMMLYSGKKKESLPN